MVFLHQIKQIVDFEKELRDHAASILTDKSASLDHPLRRAKEYGFSDRRLAKLFTTTEDAVRKARGTSDRRVQDRGHLRSRV